VAYGESYGKIKRLEMRNCVRDSLPRRRWYASQDALTALADNTSSSEFLSGCLASAAPPIRKAGEESYPEAWVVACRGADARATGGRPFAASH